MTLRLERLAFDHVKKKYPDLRRNGFETAVRKTLKDCAADCSNARIGFIPDGWFSISGSPELNRQHGINGVFVAIEIEDTHPLGPEKLELYCDLYDTLDYYDWGLFLLVFDRYGQNERELNLCSLHFSFVRQRVQEEREANRGRPVDPIKQARDAEWRKFADDFRRLNKEGIERTEKEWKRKSGW